MEAKLGNEIWEGAQGWGDAEAAEKAGEDRGRVAGLERV